MTNDNIIGVGIGLLVCAVVIVGNLVRSDPHLVSVYPDVVSVAVAPFVVYVIGRRQRLRGASPETVVESGIQVAAIAGIVFAAGLGIFTIYWLPAWPHVTFVSGVAFTSVFLLSSLAAYMAGHKRIIAV
jgi:hypothetical protein